MPQLMGNNPNQIPSAGQLGRLAFQGPEDLVLKPAASMTPQLPGEMCFQLTSDTSLTIKVRGVDGVLRSVSLTLA